MGTPGEGETVNGTEFKLSELCSVINYLRKEKEIVDMQLVLCERENARLRRDSDTSLVPWKTQGLLVSLSCYNRFDGCVILLFL